MVDRDDVVGSVPAQPGPALGVDGELDPGAPVEPARRRPGTGSTSTSTLEVRQPRHLLADDVGLQRALARQGHVLEVAPPAQPRAGVRARWRDAVGRRVHDLDGIRAHEPLAGTGLGDLGEHPLAGDRVPDEEHLALVAGDAVTAVGDRR